MFVLVIGALVAVVAVPLAMFAERRKKKRLTYAEQLAAQHGFIVDTSTKSPPPQQFDLFGMGSSKKVSFQFWRSGEQDSVFNYQFTTGSGKNKTTHYRTLALVQLPFAAPHTKIGPEGFWSGVGRMVGVRDIEIESAEFNDQYRVTGDDERFAVAFLDHQMLTWLLSSQSGQGSIKFELWGSWLLCVSDRIDMDLMFGFLDWAQNVRSHIPTVLTSLYPSGSAQ
jgi:hypothetical protein